MSKRILMVAVALLIAGSAAFAQTQVIGPTDELVAFFRAHGIDEEYLSPDVDRHEIPWETYLKMNQIGLGDDDVRAEMNRLASAALSRVWDEDMDELTLKVGHLTWTRMPYEEEDE